MTGKNNILIATIGNEPSVLVSTLWGLHKKELLEDGDSCHVVVITTRQGLTKLDDFELADKIKSLKQSYNGGWLNLASCGFDDELTELDLCEVTPIGVSQGTHITIVVPQVNNSPIDDLTGEADIVAMSDLILHVVQKTAGIKKARRIYSISGGRKNMSALLKECASWFATASDSVIHVFPKDDTQNECFPVPAKPDGWVAQLQAIPLLKENTQRLFEKACKLFSVNNVQEISYEQFVTAQRFYAMGGFRPGSEHEPKVTVRIIRQIAPNAENSCPFETNSTSNNLPLSHPLSAPSTTAPTCSAPPYNAKFSLEFKIDYNDPFINGDKRTTIKKIVKLDSSNYDGLNADMADGLALLLLFQAKGKRQNNNVRPWVSGAQWWDDDGIEDLLILKEITHWLFPYNQDYINRESPVVPQSRRSGHKKSENSDSVEGKLLDDLLNNKIEDIASKTFVNDGKSEKYFHFDQAFTTFFRKTLAEDSFALTLDSKEGNYLVRNKGSFSVIEECVDITSDQIDSLQELYYKKKNKVSKNLIQINLTKTCTQNGSQKNGENDKIYFCVKGIAYDLLSNFKVERIEKNSNNDDMQIAFEPCDRSIQIQDIKKIVQCALGSCLGNDTKYDKTLDPIKHLLGK